MGVLRLDVLLVAVVVVVVVMTGRFESFLTEVIICFRLKLLLDSAPKSTLLFEMVFVITTGLFILAFVLVKARRELI